MYKAHLEEDYEAIYKEGWRPDPYGTEQSIPVGQLYDMCSPIEREEREMQQRLSKYEVSDPSQRPQIVNKELAIKEFKRSCVGREFTLSMDLRPWSVLKRTLDHLLLNICFRQDDWMLICDFVFDRLKAVRQDMVIQRIEGLRYIEILEGSVRFLVYSMYRLTCTLRDYSMNMRCQRQPSKKVISNEGAVKGLDNYEMNVVREMKLTMKCLRDCLNSLIIQYQENVPNSPNRSLFEAVNLIVNLPFLHGHSFNRTDFQANSELRNSDEMFKTVFKMYREHLVGNHWSALKYLPQLIDYPLLVLAYAPAIAQLQVHLTHLLRKLYSTSGTNTSSVRHLCAILCPEYLEYDEEERVAFGTLMAVQFGFYNEEKNVCDYKSEKVSRVPHLPRDFEEKARMEASRVTAATESAGDNETRIYALQMIAGKDWSFYQEVLNLHGLRSILDSSQ